MFNILLQRASGILTSLISVTRFSKNFNSVFHKTFIKLVGTLAV